jgi:hypothetical protein
MNDALENHYEDPADDLTDDPTDDPPDARHHAIDFFLYSSRVERFVVEVEQARTRSARMATIKRPQLTAQEQLDKRETLFMFEDIERRVSVVSEWTREADKRLENQPREAWSDRARAQFDREKQAQEAYQASLEALATVIEQWDPDLDAVAYLDSREADFRAAEAERDARAVGPSGKHRIVLGGASLATDDGFAGSGRLRYAFIAEYLGEQRRRGLRPDIESQVFDLQLNAPVTSDVLTSIDAELTLFGFKTIEQPLNPMRSAWDDVFGWGFDGKIRHDGTRKIWTELALGGGYILPVWKSDYASSHLIFGVYPEVRALFVPAGTQGHVASRLFARARIHTGGSYANAFTAELATGQAFQFPLWDWAWRTRARVALDFQAGAGVDPWVVRPFVEGEFTNESYEFDSEGMLFWRSRAGLEIEL